VAGRPGPTNRERFVRWQYWPGVGRWFARHLASIVLIPLGLALIASGIHLVSQPAVAITLLVLGTGAAVFGSFSPRLEGPQEIGPSGAKLNIATAIRTSDATLGAALTAVRMSADADRFRFRE
jgi:hypothetical protein